MLNIDASKPALVTGATGYVAGWLVRRLLEEGLTVHAAVRDPDNEAKIQHLDAMATELPGSIRYFKADLLTPGSYQAAMQGCNVVFHTASPFTLRIIDPQRDLVDPAKLGTRNVLEQASQTPSVTRVVVTSSVAAVYGDLADLAATPKQVFDESVWNTSSSLEHSPYSFSKVEAEREAWRLAEQQSQWDLVTINPSLVIGPGTNPNGTSESFNIVRNLGNGTYARGAPHLEIGVVDVRDVAEAHFRAGYSDVANGRYLTSGHSASFLELADQLRDNFGDVYPLPTKLLPKFMVVLLGPLANKSITRKFLMRNVGLPFKASNDKIINDLKMEFRPISESINTMFQQLIDNGRLKPR